MKDLSTTQEHDDAADAADHEDSPCSGSRCRHGRRHGFVGGVLLGVLVAGAIGFGIGVAMPAAHAAFGMMGHHERGGWDGPGGDHEHGGPGGEHDGPPTAAEMRDHAEFFTAFTLHRIGASVEQQEKVLKIVDGAIDKAFPTIEKHRANREALRGLLKAATIDRGAVEKLRAEEVALADELSKVLAQAVGDSAEVLTAQQRGDLLERLDRFRHHS